MPERAACRCVQMLRQVQWAHLMVDEAHRLKNNESALYQVRSCLHKWQHAFVSEAYARLMCCLPAYVLYALQQHTLCETQRLKLCIL